MVEEAKGSRGAPDQIPTSTVRLETSLGLYTPCTRLCRIQYRSAGPASTACAWPIAAAPYDDLLLNHIANFASAYASDAEPRPAGLTFVPYRQAESHTTPCPLVASSCSRSDSPPIPRPRLSSSLPTQKPPPNFPSPRHSTTNRLHRSTPHPQATRALPPWPTGARIPSRLGLDGPAETISFYNRLLRRDDAKKPRQRSSARQRPADRVVESNPTSRQSRLHGLGMAKDRNEEVGQFPDRPGLLRAAHRLKKEKTSGLVRNDDPAGNPGHRNRTPSRPPLRPKAKKTTFPPT